MILSKSRIQGCLFFFFVCLGCTKCRSGDFVVVQDEVVVRGTAWRDLGMALTYIHAYRHTWHGMALALTTCTTTSDRKGPAGYLHYIFLRVVSR